MATIVSPDTVARSKRTIMYLRKFSHNILQRFVPAETRARAVRGTRLGGTLCTTSVREVANARVVDLRTDSRDQVSAEMVRYMMEEKVTMKELQDHAAAMLQMEDALFVPSATMGNLVAVMAHCSRRGDEMLVGDLSHMHVYEQGGSAQLAGVHSTTLNTLPNGTFELAEMESKIRHGYPKTRYTRSRLICLENTHNIVGGRVLPLTFLKEVRALADRHGLSVHMDGARLMNAAVALGLPPATILQYTDSVTVSLSKALGAPLGAILAGPRDFIVQAARCRTALGGGIREVSHLAASGKLSLGNVRQLQEDHCNARTFAKGLLACDPPLFAVDMESVQTNIVRFHPKDPCLSPAELCRRMALVEKGEEAALGQRTQVLTLSNLGNFIRAVWHPSVSAEDTQLAIRKMQYLAFEYTDKRLLDQLYKN